MVSSDRTLSALTALVAVLRDAGEDIEGLVRDAQGLAEKVAAASLGDALAGEKRPLLVTRLTRLVDRLIEAGSEVRRAEAHQLREEGYTQERIAEVFGVTRQRAGALLKVRGALSPTAATGSAGAAAGS
jgi:hypothetical protein